MSSKPKKESSNVMTTIQVSIKNRNALHELKRSSESFNDVISRLFYNHVDVNFDLISVDNELPQLHSVIIQLGDDTNSLYYFDGAKFEPMTLKEANKLLKQPKLNITFSREEMQALFNGKNLINSYYKPNEHPQICALFSRIKEFLEPANNK